MVFIPWDLCYRLTKSFPDFLNLQALDSSFYAYLFPCEYSSAFKISFKISFSRYLNFAGILCFFIRFPSGICLALVYENFSWFCLEVMALCGLESLEGGCTLLVYFDGEQIGLFDFGLFYLLCRIGLLALVRAALVYFVWFRRFCLGFLYRIGFGFFMHGLVIVGH